MKNLIIIGGGPAGLTAAIYASRYKMDFLVLSKESGGQINETHKIQNYPGFESIAGFDLGQKFTNHAKNLGAEVKDEITIKVKKIENGFEIATTNKKYQAKNIIFALGTNYRRLRIPGEKEFFGKGVSYCATCDGPFFKEKKVAVVGGGNSAASAAGILAEYAKKVTLFYRGDESMLKMTPAYQEQLKNNSKINLVCCTELKKIKGNGKVESVVLNHPHQGQEEFAVDGIFIEIGSDPSIELLLPLGVEIDEQQFVKVKADQSTNVSGIYAAGDITTGSNKFRQIITAASEGAIATLTVYDNLK